MESQKNTSETPLLKSYTVEDKNILSASAHQDKLIDETKKMVTKTLVQEGSATTSNDNREKQENLEELFQIEKSYVKQMDSYRDLGLLTTQDGKEGMIGADGTFYPMLSLDEVKDAFSKNEGVLKDQHSKGFKKIVLMPRGMPDAEFYKKVASGHKSYAGESIR